MCVLFGLYGEGLYTYSAFIVFLPFFLFLLAVGFCLVYGNCGFCPLSIFYSTVWGCWGVRDGECAGFAEGGRIGG